MTHTTRPTVLNDQRQPVPCPDYYEEQGGKCQRLDNFFCNGCPDRGKRSPTARTVRPLTEGYVHKGGHNAFPSQVTTRPDPPAPSRIVDADFAQVELRVVFMAGWEACFAKRDSEGNVPPDADDRADAQKAFEEYVKNYGGKS